MIVSANPNISKYIDKGKVPLKYLREGYKPLIDLYRKNNFGEGKFMFDRTGSIPHYLNITNTQPLKQVEPIGDSLEKLVERRCKELLSHGKVVNVSWSGGIDSTFVLFALLHYADDRNQVKIYGTYNSVLESGYVFDKYLRSNVPYNITTNQLSKDVYKFDESEICVTGGLGNQLFYSDSVYSKYRDSCILLKDGEMSTEFIKKHADVSYKDILEESNQEFFYPAISNSQRKIETLQDLRWFISFNFTWYSVCYSPYNERDESLPRNIYNFFETDYFQNWAITNKDIPSKRGDYTDDRWQLRELLSYYMGDTNYPFRKKNTTSILAKYNMDWLFLLEDYSRVYV